LEGPFAQCLLSSPGTASAAVHGARIRACRRRSPHAGREGWVDGGRWLWDRHAVLIFFAVCALLMLGFFGLGLVLFTDMRGIGSHFAARNRAVVEEATADGRNAGWFLLFGRTRRVGAFLMVLCGVPLLISLVGFVEALAGIS
jgi:hypothetical protein